MFALGEIVVIWHPGGGAVNSQARRKYGDPHGMEVEIIELPGSRECRHCGRRRHKEVYGVLMPDGVCWGVAEQYLRKRRPPIPEEVLQIFQQRPCTA